MCGIAGWIGSSPGECYATRMMKALHHRGPDGHGIKRWPETTLIHTRLSIIDLTPTGAQPMANEDGTIWTTFNGEIYNHRELRKDLESHGHVFRGRSDTEVIPHLYEQEGPDFVRKLRGMFALALYDTRTHTLVLARDRFGIKPLFYAPGRSRLAFASEIRALFEMPDIDMRPDRQAVYDFAALFYIPAPETFYRGIRALQPGEMLQASCDGDRISLKSSLYHRWLIAPDPGMTVARATDRADELLTAAVRRQLESDVPIGSLLSGGIDSSLVSAAAQEALFGELHTFNVHFSAKEYDETWAALAVANHIHSRHKILDMDDVNGSLDYVIRLLLKCGQPFADTSLFAVNAICRLMRQYVTVAISGDGGDEAFGGYDIYWRLARIARWQNLPSFLINGTKFAFAPLCQMGMLPGHLSQRLDDMANADDTSIIQSLFCVMNEREHNGLFADTNQLPVRRLFEPQWESYLDSSSSRLERLSAHATEVNTRLTLANDFLFKVDAASMMESLEVRVPMLDEELFAFGLSLPHYLKANGRTCKRILRKVAARRLPAEVVRKPKWGFSIPLESWIGADLKKNLRSALLSDELSEFFRPDVYKPMIDAFCEGHPYQNIAPRELYPRMIMLLSVHLVLSIRDLD